MSCSSNNWKYYQQQLTKYIDLLGDNPYVDELKEDLKNKKIQRILNNLNKDYQKWFIELISSNIINENIVDTINDNFTSDLSLKYLGNYIHANIKLNDIDKLRKLVKIENINKIGEEINKSIPKLKLNPGKLKFVTTTAIAYLNTSIDFKKIYNLFEPPKQIVDDSYDELHYNNDIIGKIVGCKTGDLAIKGFFKKDTLGDFYNCATVNVVMTNTKSANVKIFNNGKLQMTGIPHPDLGKTAVKYVTDLLKNLSLKPGGKDIIQSKKRVELKNYKTVMINSCYDIGFSIDRESLYNIILTRYKLNTIFDSEGYPGVRIEYYYNTNNTGKATEGKCVCPTKCKGKGTGIGEGNCRKISIAIFQSGSAIIAGGCSNEKPIYDAYNFINKILGEIITEIYKPDSKSKKLKKERNSTKYIEKTKISNLVALEKIAKFLAKSEKGSINLEIITYLTPVPFEELTILNSLRPYLISSGLINARCLLIFIKLPNKLSIF